MGWHDGETDYIVRAGDSAPFDYDLAAGVAFDESRQSGQLVEAHSDRPLLWQVFASGTLEGAELGDTQFTAVEITVGTGSSRSTFELPLVFGPPFVSGPAQALLSALPGVFLVFPVTFPAETVVVRARQRLINAAPETTHHVSSGISASCAPIWRPGDAMHARRAA